MKKLILVALVAASAPAFANDVDPYGFETQTAASGLTRADVAANMKRPQAVTMKIDDQGRLITTPSTRSRAQVAAEAQAASRMGLLRFGELGPIEATEAQETAIRLAGLRALEQSGSIE